MERIVFTKTDSDTWLHPRSGVKIEKMGNGRYRVVTPSPWRMLDSRSGAMETLARARKLATVSARDTLVQREGDHATAIRDDFYRTWDAASDEAKACLYGVNAQESASRGDFERARAWIEAATEDAPAGEPTVEELDSQMDALQVEYRSIRDRLKALGGRRDKAVDARIAGLTDEQIMGDEKLLRWLLRESFSHSGAHHRVDRLVKPSRAELSVSGYDARDEWEAHVLPALTVTLVKDQAVGEVAEAIREWTGTWALGRTSLVIGILDRHCGGGGSFNIDYDLETGVAGVRLRSSTTVRGTLEEALTEVATNIWYRRAGDEGSAGGYDEDYDY